MSPMSVAGQLSYDPEQEIRFAVVLYGGVSLAIYINGVAQELLRMVRATADLPPSENLTGTESIYRELGQILGYGDHLKRAAAGVDPENTRDYPILTRFVVDILSGSSAGGINGVALAKALALKSKDLRVLKRTWLEEAQLDWLLNDKSSEPQSYPPHPARKVTSLLNSERMYGKILETLTAMNPREQRTPQAGAFVDKLDLFVTATDLTGLLAPIQLTGNKIDEQVHKTVFHFEYTAPEHSQAGADNGELNEFESKYDPMLAFAARCTSSFPVAFEPMRFDRIEGQLKEQHIGLTLEDAQKEFANFFPAYVAQNEPFRNRPFADGGYLDNRPFSYVVDLIPYRSSNRPVKRKLLFIDPFPELHSQSTDQSEISFVKNAILAAMTLPRYEVIRGDIQTINAYNRRLDRLFALGERDEEDSKQLSRRDRPSPDNFGTLDLKAMVETYGYGEFYPRYHHLRVYETTDVLARMVTRVAGFETDSDQYYFLRRLLRAWREEHYASYDEEGKETENAFLYRFDIKYRLRRLNHLRNFIDEKLRGKPEISIRDALRNVRLSIEDQLARTRDESRKLKSRTRSPLRMKNDSITNSVKSLQDQLPDYFDDLMRQTDREGNRKKAVEIYRNEKVRPHIDAVMNEIRQHLERVFCKNRNEMGQALPKDEPRTPEVLREIRRKYDFFHWHDVLSLPFLEGSDAKEHSEVEIYRISPVDTGLKPSYVREGQGELAGTAVAAFGGFLQREWREHDMMWGRLDGAERIITALLPEPENDELRDNYIGRAQDVILSEEFSLADPDNRDRIFYWLANKLRDKNVTDASAQDLIKRGQDVLQLFPSLAQVISDQEFRTFLLDYYSPPPPPEPEKVAAWSARSFEILGRMIDDLPEGHLSGIRAHVARVSRLGGGLLTTLLRFATLRVDRKEGGRLLAENGCTGAGVVLVLMGLFVHPHAVIERNNSSVRLLGCVGGFTRFQPMAEG